MPVMRPPTFEGTTYNGVYVAPEELPDVLEIDVADLLRAGWTLALVELPPEQPEIDE